MKKFSLIVMFLASCATTKSTLKSGGKISLQCAEDSLASRASTILPSILAILSMSSDDWRRQAEMYAENYGKDVVICAARTAIDKLTAPVQSEALAVDLEAAKKIATARLRSLELEGGYASDK